MALRKKGSAAPRSFAENRERLEAMAKVAEGFEGWSAAGSVLREVRSVRTIFVQLDRITRVGGLPIERFTLVHGPSSHGKTSLALGLGLSFLQADHFFALIDAEHTTPLSWVRKLMRGMESHPGFVAHRPRTYEAAVDAVRSFCETIGEAKVKGRLPADTAGLFVVDSIRKLVPKKLLEKLLKEGSDAEPVKGRRGGAPAGVDGFGGRAAQIKAALNAAWLDELTSLMASTGTAGMFIARETDDLDAPSWGPPRERVGGGVALIFESSLRLRCVSEGSTRDTVGGDPLGERHRIEIKKTKVSARLETVPRAYFHTSNGASSPEGFEPARDLLELGLELGVFEAKGTWNRWGKVQLGQGTTAAVKKLAADPELMRAAEAAVRERFAEVPHDAATGVVAEASS